jgi:fructoselysine-6-P-deglycase FrlB-like protein
MGKPYSVEIAGLAGTLLWSSTADVERLIQAISTTFTMPLVVVGSGGSLTACHLMATLHRRIAQQPARVCTPLAFIQEGSYGREAPWFISAGGSNSDILKAFEACVDAEPPTMGVLCGSPLSPLAQAALPCGYCESALFDLPGGKDGFLATNSLLAFCVLLTRAYETLQSPQTRSFRGSALLQNLASSGAISDEFAQAKRVLERETVILLHGSSTRAAAHDLESRFTEAALGHVQAADYRNFAHGRHYWLARHGEASGVVAFCGPEEATLAAKTLEILPPTVPVMRIDLSSDWKHAALEAIAVSIRMAQWKGTLCGIDPGRPGVPLFGHRIYDLKYENESSSGFSSKLDAASRSAIVRKTRQAPERLAALGILDDWVVALDQYRAKLRSTRFASVVFDYDGTLVGPTRRTEPPETEVVRELSRLLGGGVLIGIATGRGVSVRDALRRVLPAKTWGNVEVGYYNGAVIAPLADKSIPSREGPMCPELAAVARGLREHRELQSRAVITERPHQITIEPTGVMAAAALWAIINDLVSALRMPTIRVVQSAHSVDVLAPGVSKRNVVEHIWKRAGKAMAEPLCVGDRGRWPGNDFELLAGPHSLSVDEVSATADRCWNLGSPRIRGVDAVKDYLRRLQPHDTACGVTFLPE